MAALGTADASVTTTSSIIVPANNGRRSLIIVNDSDTDIYLSEGSTAVSGKGVKIGAFGGTYNLERHGLRHRIHTGKIEAIHGGVGSKKVAISELDEPVRVAT